MELLNPLGLLNNDPSQLVRVEDVPSGLACNCYCAKCGERFEAVHSTSRRWHFRHHESTNCDGSFESAVHLLAKEVLVQTKCLMLPELKVKTSKALWVRGTRGFWETVVEPQLMHFDTVKDEVGMDGRVPDIVMWKGDRKLLVEIFVTHDLTEEKLVWIRERDLATISVNLSWANYDINADSLTRSLHEGLSVEMTPRFNIVSWVHHPWTKAAQERVDAAYVKSQAESEARLEKAKFENNVVAPAKPRAEKQRSLFANP